MSKLVWDDMSERAYETGVDHGVLYKWSGNEFIDGVAWNGLTNVDSDSEGFDVTPLYSGDVKSDIVSTDETRSGNISAYTYPEEFEPMIGSAEVIPGLRVQNQRDRSRFGLCYRNSVGNGLESQAGYKIHLIYNAYVEGVSTSRSTISDSLEAVEFSWDFSCIPLISDDYDPYAEVVIDSRKFNEEFMSQLLDILYGTDEATPRMPTLDELVDLFYATEPVPEEWDGYPYETLLPSSDLYPKSN